MYLQFCSDLRKIIVWDLLAPGSEKQLHEIMIDEVHQGSRFSYKLLGSFVISMISKDKFALYDYSNKLDYNERDYL